MTTACRPTWFATLRRDRGLFALVGALVMLLNVMQPLTAAQAGEQGHWVICTVWGAEKPVDGDDLPSAWPGECPICIAGHGAATGAPAYKAALSALPAFPEPARLALSAPPVEVVELPVARPGDPPPAIRAPPVSA